MTRVIELLKDWKAPQNELSKKATIMKLPNFFEPHNYAAKPRVRIEKVAIRSSATGKVYGSKAIAQRVIDSEDMMKAPFLTGAVEMIREAEERKHLDKELKHEHKGLKKQIRALKAEVAKIKDVGGKVDNHPYAKGVVELKTRKKAIKKLKNKLAKGASLKKIKNKAVGLLSDN